MELLGDLILLLGYRETSRRLGVSDTAVRKHYLRRLLEGMSTASPG
jgi:hypothetical protein